MTENISQDSCGCGCSCGGLGGNKKGGWIIFLLALGFILYVIFNSNTKQLNWITDYQQGLKMAREQNKPLMLTFVSDSVQFCQDMRANTYPDKDVIRYVTDTFIPVLINADQEKLILDQYRDEVDNYYPSHVIKYVDKAPSRTVLGYKTPKDFIQKLQEALAAVDAAIQEGS